MCAIVNLLTPRKEGQILESSELIAAFDKSFSREFQIEALKQLDFTYRESMLLATSEYGNGFGKNVRPQIRVEKFNKRIVDLAKEFGLKAEERLTSAKNYKFAFLEGKEMLLLVKLGEKPLELPDPSVYRLDLVASNNPGEKQLNFLDNALNNENENVISIQAYKKLKGSHRKNRKPCGILVHGYSKSASVNFAQVLVPDSEYSTWLAVIDLAARYPGVLTVQKEEVIEISQPTIRKKDVGEGDA